MGKLGVFEVVDVKLVATELERQVLHAGHVDVPHHAAVGGFEVVDLRQHLLHGGGPGQIGPGQPVAGFLGQVQGHGPGKGEHRRQHHHAKSDEGPRFGIGAAEPHVAEPVVEGFLHPGLDIHPVVRIVVVVPAE